MMFEDHIRRKMSLGQVIILSALRKRPGISAQTISQRLNRKYSSDIMRTLQKLMSAGLIQYHNRKDTWHNRRLFELSPKGKKFITDLKEFL